MAEENENKNIMDDFVVDAKVDAFIRCYGHTDVDSRGVETFDDTRLRAFFSAYAMATFDPLVGYVSRLEENGYRMNVNDVGECVFLVRRKSASNIELESKKIVAMLGAHEEDD